MSDTPTALRQLADLIEQHPDLTPQVDRKVSLYVGAADAADFADKVRRLGGKRTKEEIDGSTMCVRRDFGGGVTVTVVVYRGEVCERRVVGVETVEVPDPQAPMVKQTREVVEWVCPPILGEA